MTDSTAEPTVNANDPADFERFLFKPEAAEEPEEAAEVKAETPEPEAEEVAEAETPEAVDDETEEEATEEAPATHTVKVDGKEVAVTLEDLKRAYSGQAYIQKGMQEAAHAKKQAEALLQALQAEQAQFQAAVQHVQKQGIVPAPKAPDPAMVETDPIGYMRERAAYEKAAEAYREQQAQIRTVAERQAAIEQRAMQEYMVAQAQLLQERIPDFRDAAKANHLKAELTRAGTEYYGFTEDEIAGVVDARHVQVLHDAAQWRKLQAAKAVAVKPVPKSVKPTPRREEPAQLARARVIEKIRKSGGGDLDAIQDYLFKR